MGCFGALAGSDFFQAGSDIFHIEQLSISFLFFGKSSSDSTDCVNYEKSFCSETGFDLHSWFA